MAVMWKLIKPTELTVTTLSPGWKPRVTLNGSHGLADSFSAKTGKLGRPNVAISPTPGMNPATLRKYSLRKRPTLVLALVPTRSTPGAGVEFQALNDRPIQNNHRRPPGRASGILQTEPRVSYRLNYGS